MNTKTEYSRCVLPGITPKPTDDEKKEDKRPDTPDEGPKRCSKESYSARGA